MKRIVILGAIFLLAVLSGCNWLVDPPPAALTLTATPDSGYPPLAVTLRAKGPVGGQYTFVVEGRTYQQVSNTLAVTLASLPCEATVVWMKGSEVLEETIAVGLVNEGPVIGRPVLNGIANLWWIIPRSRYVVTFPDAHDPEGGPVTLIGATVHTTYLGELNTVFCPPYVGQHPPQPDEYHVGTGAGMLQNAFVFHSIWQGPIDMESGLPYAPPDQSEAGYPGGHTCVLAWPRYYMPGQDTMITATFEDECGARTTESWAIPTSPHPSC